MSLVDEIEALADRAYHYMADQEDWDAFRGRIAAIESELNDLRKPTRCWDCGRPAIKHRTDVPPRVESHKELMDGLEAIANPTAPGRPFETRDTFRALVERTSALPCSNVSDWDGEDGG